MASRKSVKSRSKVKGAKGKLRKAMEPEAGGDAVRLLPNKNNVFRFIKEITACKSKTSSIGGQVSVAAQEARECGIDVPMARMTQRLYAMALNDPIRARTGLENFLYYLLECTDFDKFAPAGMFPAAEVRSSKPPKKRGNGKPAPEPAPQVEAEFSQDSEKRQTVAPEEQPFDENTDGAIH